MRGLFTSWRITTYKTISTNHGNEAINVEIHNEFAFTVMKKPPWTIVLITDTDTGYTEYAVVNFDR